MSNQALENKSKVEQLLDLLKKNTKIIAFIACLKKKHKFYSTLSLNLIIDNNLLDSKETIIKLFDEVILIKKIETENRNLIKIKKALFLMDTSDEKEILEILNPIINSKSLWKNEAIKLMSEYFLYKGEDIKSDQFLRLLNKENNN